jgi:peptidoglycan hydrolase CwlO-like protein
MPLLLLEHQPIVKQIKDKQNLLLDLENDLESNTERVLRMGEHLKNVEQETAQTRELHEARRRDLESQQHLVTTGTYRLNTRK